MELGCFTTATCAVAVAITLLASALRHYKASNSDNIPTVGSSTWWGSYWTAIKHMNSTSDLVQEGYDKYKNSAPFKIPTLQHWIVIVSGHKLLDEVRKAPDDQLSGIEAGKEIFKLDYNIVVFLPIIKDEITATFHDTLKLEGNEWRSIAASDIVSKVVSRTCNRVFVGLPLCRDLAWMDISTQLTVDILISSSTLDLFPHFMRPLVAKFVTGASTRVSRAVHCLAPIIRERWDIAERDSDQVPNDFLQWLIEDGEEQTITALAQRMLAVILVAGVSSTFVEALFHLVQHPEYVKPLREEVLAIVDEHGWTKAGLDKMWGVDSFLKESHRIASGSSVVMSRKVLKEFRFSDGTVVPKGYYVAAPLRATHLDRENYVYPDTFDPFRFSRSREEPGESIKHQMITPTPEYLEFGLGKHACPGRFLTAKIQKLMLAHIVTTYDIKLEDESTPLKPSQHGIFIAPDLDARIMFRKRAT
ncbi:hypothetical protein ID866_2888 [Astraeus odoratus]|nr:hypothetical protein ID866_2888 [Astraeus odoratus]